MNFGDRIFVAQKDGKSTKIFGYFTIDTLIGLDPDLIDELSKKNLLERNEMPGGSFSVERGCGDYVVENSFTITHEIALMKEIKKLDKDKAGRIMIGGKFHHLEGVEIYEDYILTDIPFRQGFRLFDFDLFYYQYTELKFASDYKAGRHIKVKGQFYIFGEVDTSCRDPFIADLKLLQISNYHLN